MDTRDPHHRDTALSTQDYWARMQSLREDLARLRQQGGAQVEASVSRARR